MVRPRLPLLTVEAVTDAETTVKKGGTLFDLTRQTGLGWEACYGHFFDHGGFRKPKFKALKLRGGDLQQLKRKKWVDVPGVDVVLPEALAEFLEKRVDYVHHRLSDLKCWVKAVDKPTGARGVSTDLWLCFFGHQAPVRGNLGLEHKFVFGFRVVGKEIQKHKRTAKARLQKLKGVAGQLLWVSQVSNSKKLKVVRDELWLYTRGGAKKKLPLELPAPARLSFDDAWGLC